MNIKCTHLFRAIVMVTLISSSTYLASGKDSPPSVYIARNVAWNEFIAQIASVPYESPQDSLDKKMLILQKFLKSYETEVRVGIYEVSKAIDQARARLQKAQGSGNNAKRAALQGRASKVGEVTYGIQDWRRLYQM
jgi:hypothetical protein